MPSVGLHGGAPQPQRRARGGGPQRRGRRQLQTAGPVHRGRRLVFSGGGGDEGGSGAGTLVLRELRDWATEATSTEATSTVATAQPGTDATTQTDTVRGNRASELWTLARTASLTADRDGQTIYQHSVPSPPCLGAVVIASVRARSASVAATVEGQTICLHPRPGPASGACAGLTPHLTREGQPTPTAAADKRAWRVAC
jgi:hypothetical protein